METDDVWEVDEEYLEEIEAISELNSGINALDITYRFDKSVEMLVPIFYQAIDYLKRHTNLTEVEIKRRINANIMEIELKDGYENNPNGVGYVDDMFHILSMNQRVLAENPQYIYEFLRHEMTHMMGRKTSQAIFSKISCIGIWLYERIRYDW